MLKMVDSTILRMYHENNNQEGDGIDSSFQVIGLLSQEQLFQQCKSLIDVFKIIVIYLCALNLKIVFL